MNDKLNILILTLVSGEEVISNIKDYTEKVDGIDQQLCYNMVYPFSITKSGPIRNDQVGILFTPWKVFSCDTSFLIGYDKIVNMCAPLPGVVEQYKNTVDSYIKTLAGAMQQQ